MGERATMELIPTLVIASLILLTPTVIQSLTIAYLSHVRMEEHAQMQSIPTSALAFLVSLTATAILL